MRRAVLILSTVAVLSGAAALAQPVPASTPSFGTTNSTYVSVGPSEFNPRDDTDAYYRGYYLYSKGGSQTFYATPHLPGGALLTFLELQYCDTNGSSQHLYLEADDCVSVGAPCDGFTALGFVISSSNGCSSTEIDLSGLNYTVDNKNRKLTLYLACDAADSTNALTGAVLGYKLQVSPAPGTATFNDVPTSSPQFQFVEALVAAGITAGCGGGNYCPNNPVTRGQMAVFLAKALGLQWQ
jgi:opacity protein-like surface antigen